ncbi:hypothetical protein [Synechococcus sp. MU1611]|uniref:hypothetical protein n=2 Tax=unclassified Synechococcus TaxID=2626047 RepID=UPI001CF88FB3|nr:hypothetical protein [Synechococcus sp. MU1611]MCB4412047.1 hypothetical protein [Synechococcus sp. MU1611]
MRITFIVPSPQWLTAAGVRIRYKRLEPFFDKKGCIICIIPVQDVRVRLIQEADFVIISKVFSTDSLYIISLCRTLGVKVGIDLFDDYFSEPKLSVFRKFHDWLELASKIIDFILCSTDRMKHVASKFINPDLIYKINDTKDPNISFSETKSFVEQKSKTVSDSKSFNVLWFGIGDNPYFNVGINDLSNYSNALFQINKISPLINLTILTNERALTAKNLTRISRLPMQAKLDIWTEAKEINYLRDANLAFMPVSHQRFSIAKSSNRCLTALTYGCQVLSNGFDLYSDLSKLIYQSTRDFVADYKNGTFRFNQDTISVFETICSTSYDCEAEVGKFLTFLQSKVFTLPARDSVKFCIVNSKPQPLNPELNIRNSLFPIIDGSTLSMTADANFGIEKYGDIIYFVFANHLEDLLLERWHKYLRYKYPQDAYAELKQQYRILSVQYVENSIPESTADLERLITARYAEKNPDRILGLLQSEIHQSIVSPCLRNLLMILFGCENVFYSDFHTRIKPLKVRI